MMRKISHQNHLSRETVGFPTLLINDSAGEGAVPFSPEPAFAKVGSDDS